MMTLTSLIGAGGVASSMLLGAIEPPPAPMIDAEHHVVAPQKPTSSEPRAVSDSRIISYLESGLGGGTPVSQRARGIDISIWQHTSTKPAWQLINSDGFSFSFIKATQGTWYINPESKRDTSEARNAGMMIGQYHYGKPTSGSDPVAEADYFYEHMDRSSELPPVLDIEDTELGPADSVEWADKWLKRVEELSGRKPIVYTYPSFWRDKMGNSTKFSEEGYPLWIASYHGGDEPMSELPGGWTEWLFWQNSDSGSVSGIMAKTDTNYFNGTQEDLESLIDAS